MVQIAPERMQIYLRLDEICSECPRWQDLDKQSRETIIRRIERSCFRATVETCTSDGIDRLFAEKKFTERYSSNCSRVMANLTNSGMVGSEYLINNIIGGSIDPYRVAELTSKDLCPSESEVERK